MKSNQKLNNRDRDVLEIFWDNEDSLSVNDIAELSDISKNTILPVLRKLLKEDYIKVDEVILSGKTLTRKYLPVLDREEFILKKTKVDVNNLVGHYLFDKESDFETVVKLEKLLQKKKRQLKNQEEEK